MRRYNIINMYIRGSCVSPQVSHGLNVLWRSRSSMTNAAKRSFDEWASKHETEINLQGGGSSDLEKLYDTLKRMDEVPSAIFKESTAALNGACTVVTFVADQTMCGIIDEIRKNRYSVYEAIDNLRSYGDKFGLPTNSEELIEILHGIANLPLASN